jgi:UDP-2,3-diacylglucosamine pyrophosphatase LpxH
VKAETLGDKISSPLIIIADTHLGLLSGKRFYFIPNNSASDTLGVARFIQWLYGLESKPFEIVRGRWGKPLQVRKPNSLILLGDYLELWDSTDEAVDISSRGIWNAMERLSSKKLYLIGNHDYEMSEVKGTYPQGASSIQVLPDTYPSDIENASWLQIGGVSYLFLHGHQFDWAFQHLGRAWTLVSYLRDGAEAFRWWGWILTGAGIVALVAALFFPSNSIFWSVAFTLLIAVGLPRLIITAARPTWNYLFGGRYQATKALKNFASWWKNYAKNHKIPDGDLRVVYGHTHLIDVYDHRDFEEASVDLPPSLTLVNIPAWIMDVRAEYSKILRDVALYIDDDDFHFLGWDWGKQHPFYIPVDVARVVAAGVSLTGQIVQDLKAIGWPEKLLSKLEEPSKILSLTHPSPMVRVALVKKI